MNNRVSRSPRGGRVIGLVCAGLALASALAAVALWLYPRVFGPGNATVFSGGREPYGTVGDGDGGTGRGLRLETFEAAAKTARDEAATHRGPVHELARRGAAWLLRLAEVCATAKTPGEAAGELDGLRSELDQLRFDLGNSHLAGSARKRDLDSQTVTHLTVWLDLAEARALAPWERLRREEGARAAGETDPLGALRDYQSFLGRFETGGLALFLHRRPAVAPFVERRRSVVNRVLHFRPENAAGAIELADLTRDRDLPPLVQAAAAHQFFALTPVPSGSTAALRREIERLAALREGGQYPRLADGLGRRLRFLEAVEQAVANAAAGADAAGGADAAAGGSGMTFPLPTVEPYPGAPAEQALRDRLDRFARAWDNALQAENRSGNATAADLEAHRSNWQAALAEAPFETLATGAGARLKPYGELAAALATGNGKSGTGWRALGDLRGRYGGAQGEASRAWQLLLHRLRRPFVPLGSPVEDRATAQRLTAQARGLDDPEEKTWAGAMAAFLRARADRLGAERLNDLLAPATAPDPEGLGHPGAVASWQEVSRVGALVGEANRLESQLVAAALDPGGPGGASAAGLRAELTAKHRQLVQAATGYPGLAALAEARASLWSGLFQAVGEPDAGAAVAQLASGLKAGARPAEGSLESDLFADLVLMSRVHIHAGQDLEAGERYWSAIAGGLEQRGDGARATLYRQLSKTVADYRTVLEHVDALTGVLPPAPDGTAEGTLESALSAAAEAWSRTRTTKWDAALDRLGDWAARHPLSEVGRFRRQAVGLTALKWGGQKGAGTPSVKTAELFAGTWREAAAEAFERLDKAVAGEGGWLPSLHPAAAAAHRELAGHIAAAEAEASAGAAAAEGDWEGALAAYRAVEPWSVQGALVREARLAQLTHLTTPQAYAIPKGAVYRFDEPPDPTWQSIDATLVTAAVNGGEPVEVGAWRFAAEGEGEGGERRAILVFEAPVPFRWKAGEPIEVILTERDRLSANDVFTLRYTGPNALRDLAALAFRDDAGKPLKPGALGFPYPSPGGQTRLRAPDPPQLMSPGDLDQLERDIERALPRAGDIFDRF